MQLLEHEAKALVAQAGVAVPRGGVARDEAEARAVARGLGARVAVKAQIPTGGRGKAGAVKVVELADVAAAAGQLLGHEFLGHDVSAVLVEEAIEAADEIYLGFAISPADKCPVLLLSAKGGIDVEQGADEHMVSVVIPPLLGVRPWHVRAACNRAGVARSLVDQLVDVATRLYGVFIEQRCEVLEVNPLMVYADGRCVAADARVVPDDAVRVLESSPDDAHLEFDFISLDRAGQVGLITSGAGASMLIVDLLRGEGISPVNFCDLRAGRSRGLRERLALALDRISESPGLACVAVNVFGGVTDISAFAEVLAEVLVDRPPSVPVVVRLAGRNSDRGRARLEGIGIHCVEHLDELLPEIAALCGGESAAASHAVVERGVDR